MNYYDWVCPHCHRQFQGHVFEETTYGNGPVCNMCCVELELLLAEETAECSEKTDGAATEPTHSAFLGLPA